MNGTKEENSTNMLCLSFQGARWKENEKEKDKDKDKDKQCTLDSY